MQTSGSSSRENANAYSLVVPREGEGFAKVGGLAIPGCSGTRTGPWMVESDGRTMGPATVVIRPGVGCSIA
jgi:hypothetical protein